MSNLFDLLFSVFNSRLFQLCLLAAFFTPAVLFSAEQETVWKMENGVVTIEIESVVEGRIQQGHWEKVSDITGYSGSTALIFNGDGNMYRDPLVYDAPKPVNKLSYQIWVDEPGEYVVKIRNYHQQEDGDNDIWFSYNKTIYQKLWDHDAKQWTWSEARSYIGNYQPFPLRKGINRIDIVGRSKGFTLDKMVIFKAGTPKKEWASQDESRLLQLNSDNSSPTVPENLQVTGQSTGTIGLSWSPAVDNHYVYGYEIFKDDEYLTTVHETYYTVPSLDQNSAYKFNVRTVDVAGNRSEESKSVRAATREFSRDMDASLIFLNDIPVVDGQVDDLWKDAPAMQITNQIAGVIEPEGDLSGTVRGIWNKENLYLLAEIQDDHPVTESGKHDGVEFYLDLDNSKEHYWTLGDRGYRFSLSRPQQEGEFHVTTATIQRDKYVQGLQEARTISDTGYRIEIAIPWTTLGLQPEAGTLLGFDVLVNDYDEESGGLEGAKAWHGADKYAGESPAQLGTAMLLGTSNELSE
ncbi:MAG: hypothetical protein GF372_02695 [Candidatus Marinimicrobia bacterium]|nr:hypothetical protein [Candidatus Neomarinimicrobiota bacterium]